MSNNVTLIGNLGKDPEVRQAGSTSVCNLRIATSERRKDSSGEWTDHTEWHSVTVFGNTAENVGKAFLRAARAQGLLLRFMRYPAGKPYECECRADLPVRIRVVSRIMLGGPLEQRRTRELPAP